MTAFDEELTARLESLRQQGLHRQCRVLDSAQSPRISVAGQPLLNFSSNDYLGLANDPRLQEAAIAATLRYGTGSGASRLICGTLEPHAQLERELAAFKGTEAAITFSTGYAAAAGAIVSLLGKSDFLILDKLVHACVVDAARLCGATLRVFAHNDLEDLERKLKWCAGKRQAGGPKPRILVVTESVFSMDGDQAPLRAIAELKDQYEAWLMVDEAHATGLYGPGRQGLVAAGQLTGRVEIQMGTLSKAVGASGGFICGSRALVDFLVNCARSFIFSTAPSPGVAAAATAGLKFIQSAEGAARCERLWRLVGGVGESLRRYRLADPPRSAILPLPVGDEARAVALAARLREQGILLPAIRYPTVARGSARLRLTLSAAHTEAEIVRLVETLKSTLTGGGLGAETRF